MNVLWLTHPENDYGASMLVDCFTGANSGVTNIDFYPHKWQYFDVLHKYELPNILNGCTGPTPWMSKIDDGLVRGLLSEEVKSVGSYGVIDKAWERIVAERLRLDSYDLIVLESQRMFVQVAMNELNLSHWVSKHGTPVLLMDAEDDDGMRFRTANLRVDVVLKREYTSKISTQPECMLGGDQDAKLVLAFPFLITRGMERAASCYSFKDNYDFVMLCGNTFPIREDIANALRDAPAFRRLLRINTGDHDQNLLGWADYMREAKAARCSVVPRGFGYDTVRMWEHALCAPLCVQRTPLIMANPYTHMQDSLWWSTKDECLSNITRVAESIELKEVLLHEALAHGVRHHTSRARMEIIKGALERVTNAKGLRK